ncbi:MAG: oligosaccharide flippase family protein, partial [Halioglobus sp.]|nr:oligosaccharide flippase family protein [Halioglobus sp.]
MHDPSTLPAQIKQSWRRFLRRGTYVAIIRLAGLACVFALQVLLARLIGDTGEYGKYAWGQSLLFLLGAIASLGLPLASARFVASLDAQQNVAASRRVITHASHLLLRTASLGPIVGLLLWLAWRGDLDEGVYRAVAIVALLLTPAVTFTMFYRDISRARQWLGLAMLPLQVIRPLTTAALAAVFWWLSGFRLNGVQELLMAGISVLAILLGQALIYQLRQRKLPHTNGLDTQPEYRPSRLLVTAVPIFIMRCSALVINYSNVLLVGALAGPAAAGAYFAAERLAQLAGMPKAVVSTVNQQSMAAAHATGNTQELQLLATQSAHGSLWPTLLVSLFLMFLAAPLLHLFGREFTAASPVLIILVLSNIVSVFAGPAQDLLIMTGRQNYIPRVMVFTAIGHVAALVLLLPAFGAIGAACASLFSSLLGQLWLMLLAQ